MEHQNARTLSNPRRQIILMVPYCSNQFNDLVIFLLESSQPPRGRPIYLLKANRYRYIGIGILDIGIGIIGIGYEK